MRTRATVILCVGCLVGAGVGFWVGHAPHHTSTLATVLQARGISPETITALKFVGDESSYTSGRTAIETNATWIWDKMIATAEPYNYWVPSGYRRVEIFKRGQQKTAAVLFVNETDATHLEGDTRRFMCHGLDALAMRLLSPAEASKTP